MFETLSRLYSLGKITVEGLQLAVSRGWITKDQKTIILNLKEYNNEQF